jgi:hypothetical protein
MTRDKLRYFGVGFAAAAVAVWGSACTHEHAARPASGLQAATGNEPKAIADAEGVRVIASAGTSDLEQVVPIRIAVENHSGRPLRIGWQVFSLEGPSGGAHYEPLPPVTRKQVQRYQFGSLMHLAEYNRMTVYVPMSNACSDQERLVDAPYISYAYPGPMPGSSVFPLGTDDRNPRCSDGPMSEAALERLPQGSVQDRGETQGFIYFQRLAHRDATVRLTMNLVDARSGELFGRVSIPIEVTPSP